MDVACFLSKSVVCATFVMQAAHFILSYSFGPTVNRASPGRAGCSSDLDCDPDGTSGEVCWWLYEGCSLGKCMCDPRTHAATDTGRCAVLRYLNEPCSKNDTCADSLVCLNGTCRCPHVHSSPLTDHQHHRDHQPSQQQQQQQQPCLQSNYKFLGSKCKPRWDVCYHESSYGYTSNEVECDRKTGRCTCRDGYKHDSRSCRRLHIWEVGCRKDYHCEGGAVCVDEQCACPTGYRSVAGNTKCAKIGAVLELPLGHTCDEINERGYCAHGLVCHRCLYSDARQICTKYLSGFEPGQSAYVSSSRRHRAHTITVFLPSGILLLLLLVHVIR